MEALLKSNKWAIRAITRDPNSEKANKLREKGVEVVQANTSVKEELEKAIDGAYGVFALTNFWDKDVYGKQNISEEQKQGELMTEVSFAKGVKHYIFSSLHNAKEISKGKLTLPHWTGKNLVEQLARKLSKQNPNFISSFIYAGSYITNISNWPTRTPDAVLWNAILKPDTKIPMFDVDDTGPLVAYMFDHPEEMSGKYVHGAAEYLTPLQMVEIYDRVTGDKSVYNYIEPQFVKGKVPDELIENMIWMNEYGYYTGEDISDTLRIYPQMTTFEAWLKKTGWKVK